MACRSPPAPPIVNPRMWPIDMPFAIALNSDNFDPWTETPHKYRYYKHPVIDHIDPVEVNVGSMAEVTVFIEADPDEPANIFFETMPVNVYNAQSLE